MFPMRYGEFYSSAREIFTRRRVIPRLKCDFMKSQRARCTRSSSLRGTSESLNKPLRANGNETAAFDGYGDYDLRGFARHVGEPAASLHAVSRTQSRQTYLNAHTSAVARFKRECTRIHTHTHTGARGNGRLRGA